MRLAGRVLLPLGLLVVLLALLALRGLAIDWTPLDVPVPLRTPVTYTFVPDSTATYELQVWFDRPAVGVRELPRAVDIQLEYTVAADSSTLTHANVVSPCVSLYGESLGTSVARFACRAGQKHILTVHHVTVGPALKPFHPRLSVSLDGIRCESNVISCIFVQFIAVVGAIVALLGLLLIIATFRRGPRTA